MCDTNQYHIVLANIPAIISYLSQNTAFNHFLPLCMRGLLHFDHSSSCTYQRSFKPWIKERRGEYKPSKIHCCCTTSTLVGDIIHELLYPAGNRFKALNHTACRGMSSPVLAVGGAGQESSPTDPTKNTRYQVQP